MESTKYDRPWVFALFARDSWDMIGFYDSMEAATKEAKAYAIKSPGNRYDVMRVLGSVTGAFKADFVAEEA